MDVVLLIARVLFVALFFGSALGHLTQTDGMAGYAASKGVPMAKAATLASGVLMLLGGLSVLLGVWGDLGALLLLVFLLPTAFLMHAFWRETDPSAKQTEMIQFNKDVALAGAALAFFWAFSQDPGLTVTGPLLSLG
ncbi:DoxX family protein [Promicromonospora iranensis]|uniref:Membrane protein YphA (DoxX/SURF4 family) n=1 Tax=Promicromonospora iranensis TaxID=1105144 RepID=A0ABU2CKE6_9MICO|nr:DoxX family membrane protein [Promicromonospora iranensis]MDR7381809.1 putative membrane protein YphA (DoxX/SURF4 family) [Promicromonospora iranensis]